GRGAGRGVGARAGAARRGRRGRRARSPRQPRGRVRRGHARARAGRGRMSGTLTRLFAIVMKELRQLRRDRLTFAMIVGIPTLQLLLFGYAINMDVRNLRAAVVDQADTAASRAAAQAMSQVQVIDVVYRLREPSAMEDLLRRGEISVAIVFPPDFDRRLGQPGRPAAQLIVDGSDPVIQQAARQLNLLPLRSAQATPGPETLTLYHPE